MQDDPSKNAIVRIGSTDITRYSNAIVRRAIEEITAKTPELINSITKTKQIFFVGNEPVGIVCKEMLKGEGFDTDVVDADKFEEVFSKLSQHQYDLIISSDTLLPIPVFDFVSAVKKIYPKIVLIIYSGIPETVYGTYLQENNIGFLQMPFTTDVLVQTVKGWLYS